MSNNVLFIKGTPLPAGPSRSMEVANAFLETYKQANPNDNIIEKDLFNVDIPYIDGDVLSGWWSYAADKVPTGIEAKKVAALKAFTDEFLTIDKLIIQSSMWNLGLPPQLKGYLDTIVVAGTTFKYTANGPVGLMQDKKAIHIHGSGGVYSDGNLTQHSDAYVQTILNFIGVDVAPTLWVEGIDHNPSAKEEIMEATLAKAKEAALTF